MDFYKAIRTSSTSLLRSKSAFVEVRIYPDDMTP